ncbi:lipopolysaccharide biosynthesis protein [Vibrio cyclitrophicus]
MLSKIIKHGGSYFVVSVFTKATGFILLPIITRYLSIEEYGLYSNLHSLTNILYIFATMGIDIAYSRLIYDYNSSDKRLKLLSSTTINTYFLWNVLFYPVAVVFLFFVIYSWGYYYVSIPIILPFLVIYQQLTSLNISLMKSEHNTKKLLSITTISFILTQAILVLLLMFTDLKIESFFYSQFVINSFVCIIHLRMISKRGLIKIGVVSKKTLLKQIKYGLAFLPTSATAWVFSLSDRYILTYTVSIAATGKYAFLVQITMIIQIIMQSLDTAFSPIFMRIMKKRDTDSIRLIADYFTLMSFVILGIYLGLVLIVPFIIEKLFPLAYRGDYLLMSILSMGFVFLAWRKLFVSILVYHKKASWISYTGYFPAVLNIVLNLIFIPKYGIYAAAYTTLLSFFIYGATVYCLSLKLEKVNFDYFLVLTYLSSSIIFTYVGYIYNFQNLGLNILLLLCYFLFGFLSLKNKVKGLTRVKKNDW